MRALGAPSRVLRRRLRRLAVSIALAAVLIGVPLGIVPADALAYDRAHSLASNLIGRLVLLALIVLPLWKGAHHLRSLALDFGGAERDAVVASILYGIAALGSLFGIFAVLAL